MDGTDIVRTVRLGSLELVKTYEFVVGTTEQHQVRIEKHRARALAGFRPQPVYAYVDGRLAAEDIA